MGSQIGAELFVSDLDETWFIQTAIVDCLGSVRIRGLKNKKETRECCDKVQTDQIPKTK